MEASLCLRSPQLSATIRFPRRALLRQFDYDCKSNFSYSSLRAAVRTPDAQPPHESGNRMKTLALVAGAAVVTVALASAMRCTCRSWSRRGQVGFAALWHDVPITNGAERGRPGPKRATARKEMQNQTTMRQQDAADQVLEELFERKVLPERLYKLIPNYPKIKEYFKDHLRLSDESWETLIKKWKEIKAGQDQIEIGLLLIDVCIIKGDVVEANGVDEKIKQIAPLHDYRLEVRREIVNIIKDWDQMNEWEKKMRWKIFEKKMQDSASRPFISEPSVDEPNGEP